MLDILQEQRQAVLEAEETALRLQEQRQAALEAEETALRMQEQRQAALEAEVSASLSACQSLCMPACLFSRLHVYNNPG